MCGICGFIDFKSGSDIEILKEMVSTLYHRGPDDRGSDIFLSENAIIGLGHTRLSIIDLSPSGHQPMNYAHLCIVLNGEIYNYNELKDNLKELGHKFISESDTEVVLHAFFEWGISCVSKFIGMFAFVILDKKNLEVTLVSDRAGVKPLFYYWHNGLFLFSSELKAFHKHPGFNKKINTNAVYQYMDLLYIPSPYCIFEHCGKLEPGHILKFKTTKKSLEIIKYWDVFDFYKLPRLNISFGEAKDELEKLLLSAFQYRMVSDVPVGVFLSGGFDSTAVTAILQSIRSEKLKTFTIGFMEGNNEAPFAKEIAKYIGTEHTEYYCTTNETQEIIPTLPYFYDEPFADSSAIPTMLVSKLARESVTVALSADAGDEIFAGYTYYKTFQKNLELITRVPEIAWKSFSNLTDFASKITPDSNFRLKNKFAVLSEIFSTDQKLRPQLLHHSYYILSKMIKKELFSIPYQNLPTSFENDFVDFKDVLSIALATDYQMYLQNDILTKVDRATMSVSLEGREPFLDHRIIEFAAQLPIEYKFGVIQKLILKDIVYKYVPKRLLDRPKTGFTIPIYSWLKNDLYYLLEENLNSAKINEAGFFKPLFVDKLKQDFIKGHLQDPTIIWKLLQFQMWYNRWIH